MIIFIDIKKLIAFLIILSLIIAIILGFFIWNERTNTTFYDDTLNLKISSKLEEVFELRNSHIMEGNAEFLKGIFDTEVKSGVWAYEHELKKMKYLHNWSDKQGIEFTRIDSDIVLRNVKNKGDGYALNVMVSTEYKYFYIDSPQKVNSFRIGSYHSLDLMPHEEKWFITREWYTDPFADSLHLDELKSKELQNIILTGEAKDLSNISEKRLKAIEYADEYCGAASLPEYGFKYNSKYRDYNYLGGDCANFVSQVLYEGGGFKKNRTWNYERGAGSKTWINASAFNSYMLDSGRASSIAHGTYDKVLESSYKLLPGDYIAYEVKGKVTHVSLVSGIDSKGYILVNSHNSDRYRVPWDLGWSDKGVKFWLVRVNY
ncbi:amidase domain-containing protein [Alkaliphilus peptidifermentans]|uniref:Putative amidase domain-containing protein n=1 Tax=Alkaliphilus peptidifermentans DSM 18978 TaxID=1120976 RepID=A0A1G5KN76_9FIRM|nr:amidase domain-containing protein [Alkaliphilus peptidifermentans]SCZ02113.1 Putative amidase domain-containing protein [Alkaliphilus peptidifermentans DSM 18978]